ncbi:hypothetical protein Plhal703r1_c05g0029621 [Plasmopara halstedii]
MHVELGVSGADVSSMLVVRVPTTPTSTALDSTMECSAAGTKEVGEYSVVYWQVSEGEWRCTGR